MIVFSLFISCMRPQTFFLETGSIPVVGSSKKIILGLPMQEIATESLLFIPPEKEPT
jgi:hypothetical protein